MNQTFNIFYGTKQDKVNVTSVALSNVIKDVLYIPDGDENRANLFGVDPVPGFVKSVYIIYEYKEIEYKVYSKIYIDILQNKFYQIDTLPENINENVFNKLERLQSSLNLQFGSFVDEYPEQIMSVMYLKGHEKVLEIGGNIGRNSLIISKLLNNQSNLVTLECNTSIYNQLVYNKHINGLNFNIENAAISKRPLIQQGWNTFVSEQLLEGYKRVNTITYPELVNKWQINFDTLVIDCEGAFYYILMDFPEIIENVNLIIMENDYFNFEHKQFIDNKLKQNGFYVDYSKPGGWGPCASFFYEVWKK
jgi:FkbM family methyltransferase